MQHCTYQFKDFVLDPTKHELRRAEAIVSIPPHAFDCLTYLIEHRDRVVGKDELIAAVLGKADFSDDQLGHIVRKARRAIGERGDEQGAIRTIPRVGFRWVGDVNVSVDEIQVAPMEVSRPAPTDSATGGRRLNIVLLSVLIVSVVVAIGAVYLARFVPGPPKAEEETRGVDQSASWQGGADSIAVAPVEIGSMSGAEFEWVRLGLMDFIGNRLRENGPAVIPSDNVIALLHGHTAQELTPGRIQSILQVRQVVHPVATRSDNAWVVRLELRDKDGAVRTVEARDRDVIKAARGAADQVLDMKGIKIRPLAGKATDSDQAEWYQRIEAMVLRSEFDGARQMLMTAPASQRSSFAAQLRLGRIELSAGNYAEAQPVFEHLLSRGLAESEPLAHAQAIAGLAEANQRLGLIAEASTQFSESIAVFDGLRESRDLGSAYVGRANTYFVQGREDLGAADLSSARVAFELAGDTLAIGRVDLSEGAQLMYAGRPEKALPFLKQAEQRFERFDALADLSIVLGNQIGVYLQLDRPADALQVAHVGARLDALQNLVLKNAFKLRCASALAANGQLSSARNLLNEVMLGKDSPTLPLTDIANGMLAQLELEAGRPDLANGLASQAVQGLSNSEFVSPRAAAWLVRTRALRNLSKTIESSREVVAFSAWSASTGDVGAILLARVATAEQFWSAGERKAAIEQYEIALDKSSLGRPPDDVVAVALSYGNSLIDGNDLQRASAVVGRIAPNADTDFYCALLMVKLYRALNQPTAWQEALRKAVSLAGERHIPRSFAEALQP